MADLGREPAVRPINDKSPDDMRAQRLPTGLVRQRIVGGSNERAR
jgi:hypothetical protein